MQQFVKSFVRSRGYGPWYAQDAWEHVRDWPYSSASLLAIVNYLINRFPEINSERE